MARTNSDGALGSLIKDAKAEANRNEENLTAEPRPPQSRANPAGKSSKGTSNSIKSRDDDGGGIGRPLDEDIDDLTKDLGSVSIAPKPSVKDQSAPQAIKNVAALLSSNRYKNIVILTGKYSFVL